MGEKKPMRRVKKYYFNWRREKGVALPEGTEGGRERERESGGEG